MSTEEKNKAKEFEHLFERSVERWLNKKYAQFGRWTLGAIGVALFMGVLQFIAWFNGYQKAPDVPLKDMHSEVRH